MQKIQDDFSGNENKSLSIKNHKFIYLVIFLILLIIFYTIFISLFEKKIDRSAYVQLVSGTANLNDNPLYVNSSEKLNINDIIETTSEDSLVIIEWGDGSITRLGGNTSLQVDELYVSDNVDKLNIAFELLSGKTWSNVISYIPEESYFKETFKDSEAAVRGTIFNLDSVNNYLYVIDHKVELTTEQGEVIEIGEKEPVNLESFTFIDLGTFITTFKDSAFEKLNKELDEGFVTDLKADIQLKLTSLIDLADTDIETLSDDEIQAFYTDLLEGYQNVNFIGANDDELLFNLKLTLKESLLSVSPESEKEALIESFMYDFNDSITYNNYSGLNDILIILSDNAEYINIDIMNEINGYLDKLNLKEGVETSIQNNLIIFKNSFMTTGNFSNVTSLVEGNIDNIIINASETKNSIKVKLQEFILNLFK